MLKKAGASQKGAPAFFLGFESVFKGKKRGLKGISALKNTPNSDGSRLLTLVGKASVLHSGAAESSALPLKPRSGLGFRLADISAVTKNKKIHQGRGGPGATYGNTRGCQGAG